MQKLSQAGKLYLNEFYILQEAQSDVYNFLDEIVEKVYLQLLENTGLMPVPKDLTWQLWKNQSAPGIMSVYLTSFKELIVFEKNKTGLYLQYRDIRHDSELTETDAVSITINTPNMFRKKLKKLPANIIEKAIEEATEQDTPMSFLQQMNYRSQVKLNLESAIESADTIMDFITERCAGVETFLSRLIERADA